MASEPRINIEWVDDCALDDVCGRACLVPCRRGRGALRQTSTSDEHMYTWFDIARYLVFVFGGMGCRCFNAIADAAACAHTRASYLRIYNRLNIIHTPHTYTDVTPTTA